MPSIQIELCSHFFCVTGAIDRAREVLVNFAQGYVQWGVVRVPRPGRQAEFKRAPLRVFGAATADRSEWRFHIHELPKFQDALERNGVPKDSITYTTRPMFDPVAVDYVIKPHWQDREHQPPVIEYLSKDGAPMQRLVELQTGKGKSYCAMRAIQNLGCRAVLIVRPMYIEKWQRDLESTYEIDKNDIMVVQGGNQLQALLQLAQEGALDSKVLLVSNRTVQSWLKLYESQKEATLDLGYACLPDQFFEILQAGVRVIDEVHQDFHLNFKIDLYTHVPHSMSLSATLISDDAFLNKVYEIAYPSRDRYQGGAYHRYIEARAVLWRLKNPNKVRVKSFGSNTYSHHEFEKSIMRDKAPEGMLANYLKLIDQVVRIGHFREGYKAGNRCLIFCAGIEMCTIVVEYLRKRYPHLKINRYVEEDPYENLMESDMAVSTLLSAGTAVDVPQLTTVILTTAVSSSPSNLQGFGRLRELSDGTVPQFWYFVCEDIQKHVNYHVRKRELLETRALNYKSWPFPGQI